MTEVVATLPDGRTVLDEAWKQVNALGGPYFDQQADPRERARMDGYNDAIDEALKVIERLGGMDPCRRATGRPELQDKEN